MNSTTIQKMRLMALKIRSFRVSRTRVRFLAASTVMFSCLPSQNRLMSLILREMALTSMMMAKLMTFRHRPMAEA